MSSRVQDNNKDGKEIIKDSRLSSRHTLLLCFILYQLPRMPLPTMLYKLNGFNWLIWKSQSLKSMQALEAPCKILATHITMEKMNYCCGGGI